MVQFSLDLNLQNFVDNMALSWDNHPTIILKEMVWLNQLIKLIQILKKTIATNHKNWHKKLIDMLWESHLTPK
jgi:hypothetical protein